MLLSILQLMELSVSVIKTFIYLYMFKSTKKWVCSRFLGYFSYRCHSYDDVLLDVPEFPFPLVPYFAIHDETRSFVTCLCRKRIAVSKNAKRGGVFPSLSLESRGGLRTLYSQIHFVIHEIDFQIMKIVRHSEFFLCLY